MAAPSPTLTQAVAALSAAMAAEKLLRDAHNAAYEAAIAPGAGDAEDKAVEGAHERWAEAYSETQRAAETVLDVPAATPAEAIAKQQAYLLPFEARLSDTGKLTGRRIGDQEVQTAYEAAIADLMRLASPPKPKEWTDALQRFEAAQRAKDLATAAHSAAQAELARLAPWPEELSFADDPYRHWFSEQTIKNGLLRNELTVEQAASKVAALRAYLPIRSAAIAKLGGWADEEGDSRLDAHDGELVDALEALLSTPAPDVHAMAIKMRHLLNRAFMWRADAEVDSPGTHHFQELLSGRNWDGGRPIAQLYQDAARLSGFLTPAVQVAPFDANEWIATFEALPGHEVRDDGAITYSEPEAWGAPSRGELLISDSEAVRRYRAHVRSFYTQEAWDERQRERRAMFGVEAEDAPFIIQQREAIDWAYPDGGAEHERLVAVWNDRLRIHTEQPRGAALWRSLHDWQRELVKEAAIRRADGRQQDNAHTIERGPEALAQLVAA